MQPDQNQEPPDPNLPQQADTPSVPPTNQTLSGDQSSNNVKVVQPLSPNPSINSELMANTISSVIQPETSVLNTPLPDNNVQQLPTNPSLIYPEPQTEFISSPSIPVSKTSIEKEEKQNKKRKRLILSLTCLLVVVLSGAGGFYYWYSQQDHSVYSKLTTESYSQNGIDFSFKYPSILQNDPTIVAQDQEKNTPVVYIYYIGNSAQAAVFASYIPIDTILQQLNLTSTQFISQIRTDSGSFITATNSRSDFVGCNNTILTNSGQTDAICINNPIGKNNIRYTNVRIVGATSSYQYTLFLDMLPSVWTSHQKVWQKVEKSFNYQ